MSPERVLLLNADGERHHGGKLMPKRSTTSRESISTGRSEMYGKRDTAGRFKEMDVVGRSLPADRRTAAKTTTRSGHGDQGDRSRGAAKKK